MDGIGLRADGPINGRVSISELPTEEPLSLIMLLNDLRWAEIQIEDGDHLQSSNASWGGHSI